MEENKSVQSRENPVFGRKVFFVNPPLIIENIVVAELRAEEYEAYVIDDYRCVKPVLREHENALVFIYIDDSLTFDKWYNFIKSFQLEEKLKTIFIGVMSFKANYDDRQRFVLDLKLPGGFLNLGEPIDMICQKIKNILDLNGAKGRRKYIRLDCADLKTVSGYFANKDKLYFFSVDNISSVGFAGIYAPELISVLQKNTLQPSVSLTLGRKNIVVPSVVFDTQIAHGKGLSVFLFTKEVSKEVRNSIKAFIFDVLDEKMNGEIKNVVQDLTNYSEKVVLPEDKKIPEYSDIKDSFIGNLEEEKNILSHQ